MFPVQFKKPHAGQKVSSEIYSEITHDPLLLSGATRNILTVHRETLTEYITFKRGGTGESVLLYSVVLQNTSPEGGASTYILHLSG